MATTIAKHYSDELVDWSRQYGLKRSRHENTGFFFYRQNRTLENQSNLQ